MSSVWQQPYCIIALICAFVTSSYFYKKKNLIHHYLISCKNVLNVFWLLNPWIYAVNLRQTSDCCWLLPKPPRTYCSGLWLVDENRLPFLVLVPLVQKVLQNSQIADLRNGLHRRYSVRMLEKFVVYFFCASWGYSIHPLVVYLEII